MIHVVRGCVLAGIVPVLSTLGSGCGPGPSDETLVEELRVLAMVAEPPEVAPGSSSGLSVYVADPEESGGDLLVWTCTNLGEGCLEAAVPGFGATVGSVSGTPVGATMEVTVPVPAEFEPVVADGVTVLPALVWALACPIGECEAIDLARAAPDPTSADGQALAALLGDPFGMIGDLPLHGPSLAFQTLGVSLRAAPVTNPAMTITGSLAEMPVGETVDLRYVVESDDDVTLWGYATGGGFGAPSTAVVNGEAVLTWYAPEEPAEVTLWVVATGEAGGSAVWTGVSSVR